MSTSQTIFLSSLINFLVVAALLSVSHIYIRRTLLRNRERATENYQAELEQVRQAHADELARITELHTYAREHLTRERDQCAAHVQSLEGSVEKLSSALAATIAHIDAERRQEWLQALQREPPRNEYEVEVRVGYPLLKMMGFKDSKIALQYPVRIPAASANFTAFVHFAAFNQHEQTPPHLFLYVIAPGTSLHQGIIQQVRSYARLEGCRCFIITDGVQLQIYECTFASDKRLNEVHDLSTLVAHWDHFAQRLLAT